ncbi:hypothetical protein [Aquirhabdus parva]|uniref:Uncharacterized protein n=1 Tax=Aquirhabdus parva TaxID=2283318 RepID=A0A345P977_9GAMM|nr:hypothetical protein [Aquirhabdus parva]AXI03836.1 hypothetical protein HYN46_13930 [Aquirhabdus parva]
MSMLPPIYRGDPFIYTGTYKPQGNAAPITSDVHLTASVCSRHGTTPLTLTVNPDQVNNVGQFTISSTDTQHWHEQAVLTLSIQISGVVNPPARATFRVLEALCPTSNCR